MDDKNKIITRFEATDDAPQSISTQHGEIACYSNRSPHKTDITHNKNAVNEDALGIIPIAADTTVLVIADGLGGMPAGEQASQIMIECLMSALNNTGIVVREAILNSIDKAHKTILDLKINAGTTVSIVELTGHKLRTYHAGDSSILLITNHGNIKYQTLFHSPVGYALACGVLNQEQAMRHPERNFISNYVGCAGLYVTMSGIIELDPNDTIMLASDGLTDNLYDKEICTFMRHGSLLEGTKELISQCNKNMHESRPDRLCHPDDLTLIAFRQHT